MHEWRWCRDLELVNARVTGTGGRKKGGQPEEKKLMIMYEAHYVRVIFGKGGTRR